MATQTEEDFLKQPDVAEPPNGSSMAAVLSAAIGTFVLGAFTTLAEASPALKSWLAWSKPVGPLAGKTSLGVAAWIGAWLVLGPLWRRKEVNIRTVLIASAILIGLGALGTFPSFFEEFTKE